MAASGIRRQSSLSVTRTFRLTLKSLRQRLSRSLVTLMIISVAVAFLMNTVTESLIKGRLAEVTARRTTHARLARTWMVRLTTAGTDTEILRHIASADPADSWVAESQAMGELDDPSMEQYRERAVVAVRFLDWFAGIDSGQRRRLVQSAEDIAVFDWLDREENWNRFVRRLGAMRSTRPPMAVDRLGLLVEQWPQIKRKTQSIRVGRERAISILSDSLGDRRPVHALAEVQEDFGDKIRELGFLIDASTAAHVAAQARVLVRMDRVEQMLNTPSVRRAVAAHTDRLPQEIDHGVLWRLLSDRGQAGWFLSMLHDRGLAPAGLDAGQILEISAARREEAVLTNAAQAGLWGGQAIPNRRMGWLVGVSMIVCGVGIANAMLMSVTQRLREIATLKCLGALDAFVGLMFIFEACLLGIVGGFAGALLGLTIGAGRMAVQFRGAILGAWPWGELLAAVLAALVIGPLLAGVATIFPALKAARMSPVEAVRIE